VSVVILCVCVRARGPSFSLLEKILLTGSVYSVVLYIYYY